VAFVAAADAVVSVLAPSSGAQSPSPTPFQTFPSASRDRSRKITSTRWIKAAEPRLGVC